MGLATQIKQLYTYVLGGTNPSGAASSSGDVGQMVKWLAAGKHLTNQHLAPVIETSGGSIGYQGPMGMSWVVNSVAGTSSWAIMVPTITGTLAYTWDDTLKMHVVANTTGAIAGAYWGLAAGNHRITPYGRGGKLPAFDYNGSTFTMVPLNATQTTFVYEWYGKFAAAFAYGNEHGVGIAELPPTSTPFAAGSGHVMFYLLTGNKWALSNADGTTRNEQSESVASGDTNYHLFRLEFTATGSTLYVDGVSKVTNTNNLPLGATGHGPKQMIALDTAAGDASNSIYFAAMAAYWK